MNETRRFLRYVIPAVAAVVQLIIVLSLLSWDWTAAALKHLQHQSDLGLAIAGLLISGGLGYLFGAIHHGLPMGIDHRDLLGRLQALKILTLRNADDPQNKVYAGELTKGEAWTITSALWAPRDGPVGLASKTVDALADQVHGAGALRVGTVAAGLVVAWLLGSGVTVPHYEGTRTTTTTTSAGVAVTTTEPVSQPFKLAPTGAGYGLAMLVWIGFFWLHAENHRRLCDRNRGFSEQVLTDALSEEVADLRRRDPKATLETFVFVPPRAAKVEAKEALARWMSESSDGRKGDAALEELVIAVGRMRWGARELFLWSLTKEQADTVKERLAKRKKVAGAGRQGRGEAGRGGEGCG